MRVDILNIAFIENINYHAGRKLSVLIRIDP